MVSLHSKLAHTFSDKVEVNDFKLAYWTFAQGGSGQ